MTVPILTAHVERYVSLRQALGFKLHAVARELRAYARYAEAKGDTCVRLSTATGWAEQAPSPRARHVRLRRVAGLARFLRAEDPAHEVPPAAMFHVAVGRPLPHIYTPEQLAQIVAAAGLLRETYTLRRRIYATLFGMIAATGLRISEALGLRLGDVLPGGMLRIERTKFGKSRLVPLHPTVEEALGCYLDARRQLAEVDDHVFLSAHGRRIGVGMADYTFRRVLRVAGITSGRERVNRHGSWALTQSRCRSGRLRRHDSGRASHATRVIPGGVACWSGDRCRDRRSRPAPDHRPSGQLGGGLP